MKKILAFLYLFLLVCMAAITVAEKYLGTPFVQQHLYGTWWFSLLWACLVAVGIAWICKRRMRRWSLLLLHASFVVILAGALATRLTAERGFIHLRVGRPTSTYYVQQGDRLKEKSLPCTITLRRFEVKYHEGMQAVADYVSHVCIEAPSASQPACHAISMNRIVSFRSHRFYQGSFDEDLQGSTLMTNADPWGIPITYTGYALLFISLLWLLVDPRGTFRTLLRHPMFQKSALAFLLLLLPCAKTSALPTVPQEIADQFGELYIIHRDRICPLQTFAMEFTQKVHGKAHYGHHTAEQVVMGWIFWGDEWSDEPMIKVKGSQLRQRFGIGRYASLKDFFDSNGYRLGPLIAEYEQGNRDALHRQAAAVDEQLMLVMQLRQGTLLKVFPYRGQWFAPTDLLPADISVDERHFIEGVFSLLLQEANEQDFNTMAEILAQMKKYQERDAADMLPSPMRTTAERVYNLIPVPTILFMANLTLGFLSLAFNTYRLTRMTPRQRTAMRRGERAFAVCLGLSLLLCTLYLVLRTIVSGRFPMSNGYETMLFLAWLTLVVSFLLSRKVPLATTFGFLVSGCFLLVSHIAQMDPAITHTMPVLNSPLLTLHVGIIMLSYALIALTVPCALLGLCLPRHGESLQVLSRLLLVPAIAAMGFGIFIGAIWANVSWGTYWSWDPKETWALITFMTYAIALHTDSIPALRRPKVYHWLMLVAFLCLAMTYLGVNYFLGGMHSYA